MPMVSVKVIQNFFSEEQKTALIRELTDAFCRATLEAARPYIYVTVEEVPQGKWGLAGHPLPDPDFLINDLVPIFEDSADAFSQAYGVPRRRPRGPRRTAEVRGRRGHVVPARDRILIARGERPHDRSGRHRPLLRLRQPR